VAAAPGEGRAPARPADLAGTVRRAGGTVVATGGCFDVLHAGHVSMLRTARALGDCLIICLNSDASVRRLKGAGRPLNTATDRAAVLAALECVDSVMIFEEDTPAAALRMLRPDVWVKGGDYSGQNLPEASVLGTWGGQAVTVPYLSGRSTTQLHAAAMALAEQL
jgi:rfaE bifunctional protein nucleotidyltransferase chain/domain